MACPFLLRMLADIVRCLLLLQLHGVAAPKVLERLLALFSNKTIEIERGMSLLVDSNRDGLFLHRGSPPHGESQPHLLAFRGLDHFAILQDVTLGAGDGQSLLFL